MYMDGFCAGLGIGIKIWDVSVGPLVIDPNEECCITRCTCLLTHIIPRAGDKLKKPTKFDDTEEKVAVRFEGEKCQDAIHEITLCKYLDPENELLIEPNIRFLCVAHISVKDHETFQNKKCLKIILKEWRTPLRIA